MSGANTPEYCRDNTKFRRRSLAASAGHFVERMFVTSQSKQAQPATGVEVEVVSLRRLSLTR